MEMTPKISILYIWIPHTMTNIVFISGRVKEEVVVFHCSLCDINCIGEAAFQAHVAGKKHKKKQGN